MPAAGAMWNGTWSVRRDPAAPEPAPFVAHPADIDSLPPGAREPVRALLAAIGPGQTTTLRMGAEDEPGCDLTLTPVPDGVVVVVSGAVADGPPSSGTERATLLAQASSGAAVVGPDGRVRFANVRIGELVGRAPETLTGVPFLDLVDGRDRLRVAALFDRRRTAGAELDDVRLRGAGDEDVWVILGTSPVPDAHGSVDEIVVLVTDVTERHRRETSLADAEQRFRSSFTDAPMGKALVALDGTFLEVNRALATLLGRDADALAGTPLLAVTHPGDRALAEVVARCAAGEVDAFAFEARLQNAEGATVWVDLDASVARGPSGGPAHVLLHADDITARKVAEAASRDAVARFQAAFTHAPIGMAIVGLDGAVREANPGLCRMLDLRPEHVRHLNLVSLADPDDAGVLADHLDSLRSGATGSFRLEVRLSAADGHTVWTMLSAALVADEAGSPGYAIVQAEDVTERRVAEHDLVHQTLHDPLTGLGNRLLLKDQLQQALAIVDDVPFAVMFLDLDRFKSINDTHGHDAGDALLVGVGERLRRIVRAGDTVARLGGDEFAVVARGVGDQRAAEALADKVRAALRAPFRVGGLDLAVSASVGVVLGTAEYHTGDQLLRDADIAMYRAKDSGRDRHELFDDEIRLQEIERLETERALRSALSDGGLRLHYQPVIDLHTGRVVGAEALLRIADVGGGLLTPDRFLGVAEDSRLILDVGAWVVDEVCGQLATWAAAGLGHLGIWVNMSGLEMASPRIVTVVQRAVAAHGIDPGRLRMECTEDVLLDASPAVLDNLRALTASGVVVGIDDFGTGYSSLAYLRDLPVSFLKIDPSFTERIDEPGGVELAEAIVSLGRSLDLTVVAEGVETRRQMEALARIGCGMAQGYLFGRPSPVEGITLLGDPGVGVSWP